MKANRTILEQCFKAHGNNTNDTCNPNWISDGNCDDGCNVPQLNYDGDDCCLASNLFINCLDCFCYQDCSMHFDAAGKLTRLKMLFRSKTAIQTELAIQWLEFKRK